METIPTITTPKSGNSGSTTPQSHSSGSKQSIPVTGGRSDNSQSTGEETRENVTSCVVNSDSDMHTVNLTSCNDSTMCESSVVCTSEIRTSSSPCFTTEQEAMDTAE